MDTKINLTVDLFPFDFPRRCFVDVAGSVIDGRGKEGNFKNAQLRCAIQIHIAKLIFVPGNSRMAFAVNPSGISIRWFAILFGSLDANQNAIDFGLSVIKKFSFGAR